MVTTTFQISRVVNNWDTAIKRMKHASDKAVERGANRILEAASDNLTHMKLVDTGTLLASGYVKKIADGVYAVGFSAPYARSVEEGADWVNKGPPFDPIYKWVLRNVRTRTLGKSSSNETLKATMFKPEKKQGTRKMVDKAAASMAWAIINHLKKHGQEPRPFFLPAIIRAEKELPGIFKVQIRGGYL